ncbi:MAG: hypothetical protein HWE27_08860 [Gammaproteobacteria bacterium]|nr:hypothetical protein [Gammaproteobacteria bacterium]
MRLLTLTLTLICSVTWSNDLSDKFRFDIQEQTVKGYSFTSYYDRLNAIGKDYEFRFGTLNHFEKTQSPNFLRIENNKGEIVFENSTPYFNRFFVVDNYLIAVERLESRSNQIWFFDANGKIVFQGLAKGNDQLQSIKASEEEADMSEKVVIIYCGPSDWITDVTKLIYDRFGRLEGFFYLKGKELHAYYFSDYQTYQNKLTTFASQTSFKNTLECTPGYNHTYRYTGQYVSRWCEKNNGIKQGVFERWMMNEAFFDGEYLVEELPVVDGQLIKVVEGYYQNNLREGDWWLFYPEPKDSVHCQFKAGQLSGECVQSGRDFKEISLFQDGVVHGVLKWFDSDVLEEECEYKNGVMDGRCTYFNNKIVSTFCHYSGLYGSGVCKDYDKNGNLEMECQLKGQVQHGECVNYKNGEVIEIDYYDAGEWLIPDEYN